MNNLKKIRYSDSKTVYKIYPGLREFNNLVRSYETGDVLAARLNALHELRRNNSKELVQSLADYFRHERMPHWEFLNGDNFKACLYVIRRLSFSDVFIKTHFRFKTVQIRVDPDKSAVIEKKPIEGYCKIHTKNKVRSNDGKCSTCLGRIRRLIELELINETTPKTIINRILRLPDHRGRKQGFAESVRNLLDEAGLR